MRLIVVARETASCAHRREWTTKRVIRRGEENLFMQDIKKTGALTHERPLATPKTE